MFRTSGHRMLLARTAIPLLSLTLVLATSAVGRADDDSYTLPKDFFRLTLRGGVQAFHYEEKLRVTNTSTRIDSDFDSFGPALSASANFRFTERFRLNGDYVGSFIQERSETWKGTDDFGFPFDQQNDLKVSFHVFDIDLGYSIVKLPNLEWAVAAGWHYYIEDFTRKNFVVSSIPVGLGTVTEKVRGQGGKIGTTVEYRPIDRLSLQGGAAYYYLYDVAVDNSALQGIGGSKVNSDGYAVRWRLGLDYFLMSNATIGLAYDGHYISVNQEKTANGFAILPENKTWANTFLIVLGVRY